MNLIKLAVMLIFSGLMYSCTKEKASETVTKENLQGAWSHNYMSQSNLSMPTEFEYLELTNDSMYIRYKWRAELLTPECPYSVGMSYVKGTYKLKETKIHLEGIFTDDVYIENTDSSECKRVGIWADSFDISFINEHYMKMYWLVPLPYLSDTDKLVLLKRLY